MVITITKSVEWSIGVDRLYQVVMLSIGGVLGVNARYWLGLWITHWAGPRFPWATFVINVTGSFLIGLTAVSLSHLVSSHVLRLLLITGFLGGYTTFSSYTFEALSLWERGDGAQCVAYLAGSVAAGVVAVFLGALLARGLSLEIQAPVLTHAVLPPSPFVDPELDESP